MKILKRNNDDGDEGVRNKVSVLGHGFENAACLYVNKERIISVILTKILP